MTMTERYVAVRERGWSLLTPAIERVDGGLEFAAGNVRYDGDEDRHFEIFPATQHQIVEFHRMGGRWLE